MRITCPECSSKLKASPKHYGKLVKCPKCRHGIPIPIPDDQQANDSARLQTAQPKRAPQPAPPAQASPKKVPSAEVPATAPIAPKTNKVTSIPQAAKPAAKTRSSIPLVAIIASAVVLLGTLIGAGAFFMWPKGDAAKLPSASTTPNVAVATPEVTDDSSKEEVASVVAKTSTPEPEPSAPPIRAIEYLPGPTGTLTVYETRIRYEARGEEPVEARGDLLYESLGSASSEKGHSSFFKGKKMAASEHVTGLGIPGSRVIVPLRTVQKADRIELEFGGNKYSGEVVAEYKKENIAVIDYAGPDFAAPKLSGADETSEHLYAARVLVDGGIESLVGVTAMRKPNSSGMGYVRKGYIPSVWRSGVLVEPWGTVAALLYEDNAKVKKIPMSKIVPRFEAGTFELKVLEPSSAEETIAQTAKNLVKVSVSRSPSVDKEFMVEMQYAFDRPSSSGQKKNMLRLGPNTGVSKISFPGSKSLVANRYPRKITIGPSGTASGDGHINYGDFYPPGAFNMQAAPFFKIESGRRRWRNSEGWFAVGSGQNIVAESRIDSFRKNAAKQEGLRLYKLIVDNEVIKDEVDLATIKRVWSAEEVDLLTLTPKSDQSTKDDGVNSLQFEATQFVDFSRTAGKVIRSRTTGKFSRGESSASFEFDLELLNQENAKTQIANLYRETDHASHPTTRRAKPEVLARIAENLKSERTETRNSAIELLNFFKPESNAAISQAITADYKARFDTGFGGNHRWHANNARRAGRNWVLTEHVPDVLQNYANREKGKATFALELLLMHPRLEDRFLADVEALVASDLESPHARTVLTLKYPDLLEPTCEKYLGSLTSDYHKSNKAIDILGDYGTSKSVEILERYSEKLGQRGRTKDEQKKIAKAIEKIRSRKSESGT